MDPSECLVISRERMEFIVRCTLQLVHVWLTDFHSLGRVPYHVLRIPCMHVHVFIFKHYQGVKRLKFAVRAVGGLIGVGGLVSGVIGVTGGIVGVLLGAAIAVIGALYIIKSMAVIYNCCTYRFVYYTCTNIMCLQLKFLTV